MVRFSIWLYFLFITFRLHVFLSWMYFLLISCSVVSAFTFPNHVFLGLPTNLLPSTLISIDFSPSLYITFHNNMFIPSHTTTSNDRCDRFNSNKLSQFVTSRSVFHGNAAQSSNHLHLCYFILKPIIG